MQMQLMNVAVLTTSVHSCYWSVYNTCVVSSFILLAGLSHQHHASKPVVFVRWSVQEHLYTLLLSS